MGFLLDIQPSGLGFKPPFNEYLHIQNEVIDFVFESFADDIPVVGVSVPTGGGKTLCAVSIAMALGVRTAYVTAFKGLQEQYLKDFSPYGMVDIRGRNNYQCAAFNHLDCRGGSSVGCPYTRGKGCSYETEKAVAKEAHHVTTNYSYWFNVNDKASGLERNEQESEDFGENPIELLVLDECFIPGTLVGSKRIEDIKIGDIVPSWHEFKGPVDRRVVRTFLNKTSMLVKVRLENGNEFVSTPNHPIAVCDSVLDGPMFYPAIRLKVGQYVLCSEHGKTKISVDNGSDLQAVRYDIQIDRHEKEKRTIQERIRLLFQGMWVQIQSYHFRSEETASTNSAQLHMVQNINSIQQQEGGRTEKVRSNLLFKKLRKIITRTPGKSACDVRQESENALRSDEKTKSDEAGSKSNQDVHYAQGKWMEAASSRRQWKRSDSGTTASSIDVGMGNGIRSERRSDKSDKYAPPLQTGYSRAGIENRNRGGWSLTRLIKSPVCRQTQDQLPDISRVANIEILEPGSDGEFERLCPEGHVYNLEVEETHTYIANGVVVHNCHEAPKLLADYVSCRLYEKDAKLFGDYPMDESLDQWSKWSMQMLPVLNEELKKIQTELVLLGKKVTTRHVDKLYKLQSLAQTLTKLAYARGDDWVVEMEVGTKYGRVWKFDCIFAGKYKSTLFCGVPKVLMMSATLKERTLWECGVKKGEYRFKEWGRIFVGNRHSIYMVGPKKLNKEGQLVGIGVDRKTSREDLNRVVQFMDDEIIKPRLDRKGMIATVSYDWQRIVMEESKHADLMLGNTQDPSSDTAMEVADEFRKSKPPAILVSPSFTTGWDFPMDQCEYIIIFKIPMIPVQSKIMKARLKRDPRYTDAMTMQTVEQTIGRGMRKEMDRCEVFIVDAHGRWFLYKNRDLAQAWFWPAIRQVPRVPKPPQRLLA